MRVCVRCVATASLARNDESCELGRQAPDGEIGICVWIEWYEYIDSGSDVVRIDRTYESLNSDWGVRLSALPYVCRTFLAKIALGSDT